MHFLEFVHFIKFACTLKSLRAVYKVCVQFIKFAYIFIKLAGVLSIPATV